MRLATRTNTTAPQKTYVGMDNGVSGSIGIINHNGVAIGYHHVPVFNCLNYTKEKKNINRIDHRKLYQILSSLDNPIVILERPMVNPGRFLATASALRAMEASLVVFERLGIPYLFIDSKEWQKIMLPNGIKGADALKKASYDIGQRLFPQFSKMYKKDADGILIAEWARRVRL